MFAHPWFTQLFSLHRYGLQMYMLFMLGIHGFQSACLKIDFRKHYNKIVCPSGWFSHEISVLIPCMFFRNISFSNLNVNYCCTVGSSVKKFGIKLERLWIPKEYVVCNTLGWAGIEKFCMKQCDLSAEKFIWNTFVLFFSPQAIVDKFSEMFVFSVLYILTFISPKFVRLFVRVS